jgi:hypothetical protein
MSYREIYLTTEDDEFLLTEDGFYFIAEVIEVRVAGRVVRVASDVADEIEKKLKKRRNLALIFSIIL